VKKLLIAQEGLILHGVTITHPDRMVFEEGKITKGDVARYYAAVAPLLLTVYTDLTQRPTQSPKRTPGNIFIN